MDSGELKAIFRGAQEDMAQAVESAAGKMASFGDTTAQNVRDSVAAIQNADGAGADSLQAVRGELDSGGPETLKGQDSGSSSGDPAGRSRLARLLNSGRSKPVATPISAENGSQSLFQSLFPQLAGVNRPRFGQGARWQHNCQSCVNAVDHALDGRPASAVPVPAKGGFPWPDSVTKTIGGDKSFVKVDGYDDITKQLAKAGDGARGVIWGRRFQQIGNRLVEVEGHVFNAVNRGGQVYYVDGQTGTFATLEKFSSLSFLRTK